MGIWNTLKEWKAAEDKGSRRFTKGAPAATAEEDMERITGRRNIRIVKALSAAAVSVAMIGYPVSKMMEGAGEAFSRAISGTTPAEEMAKRDGARPIRQIEQVKAKSFDINPGTLANIFLLVGGAAVGAYGAYKGSQARQDNKYLNAIQKHIDHLEWENGGEKPTESPGKRTEQRGFIMP